LQVGEPSFRLLVQAMILLGLRAFLETGLIEFVVVTDRGCVSKVFPKGLEILLQRNQLPL
jgi:hypothetical protein